VLAGCQVGVLACFAKLLDIQEGNCWSYVANSGTNGNLRAILPARENLPDGVQSSHPCTGLLCCNVHARELLCCAGL
jgi:hypothetical protein